MQQEDRLLEDATRYPPTIADVRDEPALAPLFEANEYLSAFLRRVWATTPLGLPELIAPKQAVVLVALGKAYKTHRALQILCREGYGEDAAILLRALFELAVDTRYITRSSSQKRALRWLDYDAVTRYELARVVRDDPYFAAHRASAPEGGQIPAPIVADAQAAQTEYSFWGKIDEGGELLHPKSWSDKSRKQMARSMGWASHYDGLYALTSILAHSSVRASDHFVSLTPEDKLLVDVRPGASWIDHVLLSAHVYLSAVLRAWLKEMDVPQQIRDDFALYVDTFVAMGEARIGPDRSAAARLAGAIQGDTGE